MVDAMDLDRLFTGSTLAVFIEDIRERNTVQFGLDAVRNRFPDRLRFTDRLPRAIVRLVAETDNKPDTAVKQLNHLAQADVLDTAEQPDTAIRPDDGIRNAMPLQFSMDILNHLDADIDAFSQCSDRKWGFHLMQLVNQTDCIAGIGRKNH